MMTAGLIGAAAGLFLACLYLGFSRALAARVELDDTRRVLRVSSLVQLVLLPAMGYVAGSLISGD